MSESQVAAQSAESERNLALSVRQIALEIKTERANDDRALLAQILRSRS
jgi:hypothetical protein